MTKNDVYQVEQTTRTLIRLALFNDLEFFSGFKIRR